MFWQLLTEQLQKVMFTNSSKNQCCVQYYWSKLHAGKNKIYFLSKCTAQFIPRFWESFTLNPSTLNPYTLNPLLFEYPAFEYPDFVSLIVEYPEFEFPWTWIHKIDYSKWTNFQSNGISKEWGFNVMGIKNISFKILNMQPIFNILGIQIKGDLKYGYSNSRDSK